MSTGPGSPPAPSLPNTSGQRPPSLCMKPLPPSAVSSPDATSPPITLTSKEWIVPPRPKPGRKPATDTPPTKRKAQNRAAQRAFRERRAARVGELEEQLKEVEEQNEQEQESLRCTIAELEKSLEKSQADLSSWIEKYQKLEKQISRSQEQTAKQGAAQSRSPASRQTGTPEAIGCGNCTLESHCQCIDDVVQGMDDEMEDAHGDQAPYEPTNKKIKLEAPDPTAMEIDFTTAFSKPAASTSRPHTSAGVADPCGFCQDGTPCICAEMAAEQERATLTGSTPPGVNARSGARQMAQFTPPPSEGDVATLSAPPVPRDCGGGGPGTCAQCISDPNSTLFCKSLAASRVASGGASGCCGGKNANGGCCRTPVLPGARNTRSRTVVHLPVPVSRNPVTLSCADAFTALSRHRAYEEASGDMASWMPKLHANPITTEGRPAMEIDAANVMAVLKDFDRRFGANK